MIAFAVLLGVAWGLSKYGEAFREAQDRYQDQRSLWRVKRETRITFGD